MTSKPVYVSTEGLKRLKEELEHLKTVKKPEVATRIEHAKDLGDLKENAEYHDAKDQMGWVMGRIMTLESQIGHAQVVEKTEGDTVGIGSSVQVSYMDKEKNLTVVGAAEADPVQGLISNESPLGQALIGKKVGETAEVEAPAGRISYSILEIS
jgi:transcription elongation factor GreA